MDLCLQTFWKNVYNPVHIFQNLFLQHFLTNAKEFDNKEEGFEFGFKFNDEDAGDSEMKDKVSGPPYVAAVLPKDTICYNKP